MGPFNVHFIRDAGLAFLAGGGLIGCGAWTHNAIVCVCGSVWIAFHALFHLQIQALRGFPLDIITASDVLGVMAPAALAVFLAYKFKEQIQ